MPPLGFCTQLIKLNVISQNNMMLLQYVVNNQFLNDGAFGLIDIRPELKYIGLFYSILSPVTKSHNNVRKPTLEYKSLHLLPHTSLCFPIKVLSLSTKHKFFTNLL